MQCRTFSSFASLKTAVGARDLSKRDHFGVCHRKPVVFRLFAPGSARHFTQFLQEDTGRRDFGGVGSVWQTRRTGEKSVQFGKSRRHAGAVFLEFFKFCALTRDHCGRRFGNKTFV